MIKQCRGNSKITDRAGEMAETSGCLLLYQNARVYISTPHWMAHQNVEFQVQEIQSPL